MLEVSGVTRDFVRRGEAFAALDDVTFTLEKGQFVALVGHSGSGKSTLLNIISGLLAPTSGDVHVAGECVSGLSDLEASRMRNRTIGYVTQHQTLLESLTVLDNVILPAVLYSSPDDVLVERAQGLLDQFGIGGLATCRPDELSGGETQRAIIARALMNEPALVLADEPTGNLDAESSNVVVRALRASAERGATVLMATHDKDALAVVDRVVRLDSGRLVE